MGLKPTAYVVGGHKQKKSFSGFFNWPVVVRGRLSISTKVSVAQCHRIVEITRKTLFLFVLPTTKAVGWSEVTTNFKV